MDLVQVRQRMRGVGFADDYSLHVGLAEGLEQRDGVIPHIGGHGILRDAPECFHLVAVGLVGDHAPGGEQMGERARIAYAAAGIGLSGQGERGRAGAADLPGDKVQVVDQVVGPHAADTLVDAHAPQGHGRGGFREQAPGFPYLLLGDVAELGYLVRRIVLKERPVVVKGGILAVIGLEYCVLVVETRIVQLFVQNDPRHAIHEGEVGPRTEGYVQVGDARRVGPARVGHDDLHAGFVLLAAGDTAEEDGVRFRSVGADDEEGGGPVDVGIGAHRFVLAERGRIAAHGGGHAQARVAVHVVGLEPGLENLVRQIGFLGQALAGAVPRHGIGAIRINGGAELLRHVIEGFVPRNRLKPAALGAADHGLGHAVGRIEHRDEERALETEEALIVVVGIALDGDGLAVFHADQHAAAGAAVTADALDPPFGGIGFGGAGNARGSGHSRQGGAHGCGAEKITSGHLHCHSSYSSTVLVVAWRFSYTFPCMGRA